MAKDVIARLKADTTKWDSGLAKAGRSMDTFGKKMRAQSTLIGQFGGNMGVLPGKIGQFSSSISAATTSLASFSAASAAATMGITAAVAALYAGGKELYEFNVQMQESDRLVEGITGTTGIAAERISDAARAISKVYGTDLKNTITAINTLMTQFGITGDEATSIVREGLQGMLDGDYETALGYIQRYAPAFRDAGISASELVAIIHNTEGGVFGAEGLEAIKMGGKNIRIMTAAVRSDLQELGIDAQDLQDKMESGSVTTIDALRMVSEKLGKLDPQSQLLGKTLQDVFGRQGAANGQKMIEAISQLNTDIEKTRTQTGLLGESLDELAKSTENVNKEMRALFGTSVDIESFGNILKTMMLDTLSGILSECNKIKTTVTEIMDMLSPNQQTILSTILDDAMKLSRLLPLLSNPSIGGLSAVGTMFGIDYFYAKGKAGRDASEAHSAAASYGALGSMFGTPSSGSGSGNGNGNGNGSGNGNGNGSGNRTMPTATIKVTNPIQDSFGFAGLSFGGKSLSDYNAMLSDLKKSQANATNYIDFNRLQSQIEEAQRIVKAYPLAMQAGMSPDAYVEMKDSMEEFRNGLQEAIDANPIIITPVTGNLVKDAEKVSESWATAANIMNSAGSALQNMDNKGLNIAGMIMQAIGNVILGFTSGMTQEGMKGGVWGWIAASVAGLATMTATIATIKQSAKFADGGVVPGSSYVGDRMPIMANAGELVLNYSQQQNLAENLEARTNTQSGGNSTISGEQIVTVINAYGRRTGRGEILR